MDATLQPQPPTQAELTPIEPAAPVAPEPAAPAASLWALSGQQAWFFISMLATAALALLVRLVNLDRLQDEMYGDITIVYEYVRNIMQGKWPAYFDVSAGPLYHYLITPLIALTGPTYYGFKLASVIVSLGVLAATYGLARRLVNDWFALLATAIAAVGSWLLIFSRLGNSQILVPLLAVAALWLLVRYVQDGRRADLIASAVMSALGLYVYPQSFILPGVTFLVLVCLLLLQPVRAGPLTGRPVSRLLADLGLFLLVTLIAALPFAAIVMKNLQGFLTGYIGVKLVSPESPAVTIARNLGNAALAYFTHGDISMRSNISGASHIDPISAFLLIVGIVFWLMPGRIRWSPVLFLPLVLLHLPSVLVLSNPDEIPSASRTLAAAPLVYMLIASGLWWPATLIARRSRFYAALLAGLVLLLIGSLNLARYFDDYTANLPYHNIPVGQVIAEYIDTLPAETHVYLVGCCWNGGMPEPKGVEYRVARPERFQHIDNPSMLICDSLEYGPRPAVVIWSDQLDSPSPGLDACRGWLPSQVYVGADNLPIFRAAPVLVGRDAAPPPALGPVSATGGAAPPAAAAPAQTGQTEAAAGTDGLVFSSTLYRGQTVGVRYSPLDIGQISDIFDGKPDTLMRGAQDNPLVIDLRFTDPVTATVLSVTTGTMSDFSVTATLTYADGSQATVSQRYRDLPPDPTVTLNLPPSDLPIREARVEIEYLGLPPGDGYHTHIRELSLQ
jgi:hypothetical protein